MSRNLAEPKKTPLYLGGAMAAGQGRDAYEQAREGNIGQAAVPLLVIDSWEHAFYLQYRNVKADWVDAFWHLANWNDVARRFAAARQVQLPY